jgi:hypothetical protein
MRMGFDGVDGGGGGLGRGSQERRELPFPNLSIPARSEVRSSNFDNHSTMNVITMPYSHDSISVALRDAVSNSRGEVSMTVNMTSIFSQFYQVIPVPMLSGMQFHTRCWSYWS